MPAIRLTQKHVDSARWAGRTEYIRDAHTTGLILTINKESVVWKVQCDRRDGPRVRTLKRTLGTREELPLAAARVRAGAVLSELREGPLPPVGAQSAEQPGPAAWTLQRAWDAYERHLTDAGRTAGTITNHKDAMARYLLDWADRPLAEIRKSDCRARHEHITKAHGPYVANGTMRCLRATWNNALRYDDEDTLHSNPVQGVRFNREMPRDKSGLPLSELANWSRRVEAVPRATMHLLGLYTGLRPGTLVALRREWVGEDRVVVPGDAMKSRREFVMPASPQIVALLERALKEAKVQDSESKWLFPAASATGHTVMWREPGLRGQCGHILRSTHRTVAEVVGVPQSMARSLLDHRQEGIEAHYVTEGAMFEARLAAQCKVSAELDRLRGVAVAE
ncbi:MAG: tyrosine-type recombinase/integrase [Rhodobacterales bacterium]|nr:tyrosine-type recombinase/integrase [Rhodobacterales bacterium]